MTDITQGDGVEGWIKRTSRRVDSIERAAARGRIPRVVASLARPLAAALQPGVRIFDTNLGRSLTVNAAQNGYTAEGMIQVAELADLPASPPEGLVVRVGNVGLHLVYNGLNWQLAAQPTWVRDIATRNWLSTNGVVQAGFRVQVAQDRLYRYDGTNWYTPGVAMVDLDYGVMKAAGREGRAMDAPMYADGTINGDWNAVYEPGMYRVWNGATNTNSPGGAYLFGTLVVFGANSNINSRTQVYYAHTGSMYSRTAWNANDWQGWVKWAGEYGVSGLSLPGAVRDWDGNHRSRITRTGNVVTVVLGLSVNGGSSLSANNSNNFIAQTPDWGKPVASVIHDFPVYVGSQSSPWDHGWWARVAINQNGQFYILQCNPGSLGSDCLISGHFSYPAA